MRGHFTLVALVLLWANDCCAQSLMLRNSSNQTITMKYRSTSNPSVEMKTVIIRPSKDGEITQAEVREADPYYVTFDVSDAGLPISQAKIGRPIALQQLARGEAIDVSLALATEVMNGKSINRVMAAKLRIGGRDIEVQSGKSKASEFVKRCISRGWKTVYRAQDGNQYEALVNFEKLTFETDNFTGRFTDLACFEEKDGCCLCGSWDALGTKGEVVFKIASVSPDVLDGTYIFAGKPETYFWKTR